MPCVSWFSLWVWMCACLVRRASAASGPSVYIDITPSTVIQSNETIYFNAIAHSTNGANCSISSYLWTVRSIPNGARAVTPPSLAFPTSSCTFVNGMHVSGLYIYHLNVTDCLGTHTGVNISVRVIGGDYDTAHVRVAMDNYGDFSYNGNVWSVSGWNATSIQIPSVRAGDVFALIGVNQGTQAMVAATIQWRDMNFSTDDMNWRCVRGNLSQSSNSSQWMLPGFDDTAMPWAYSQGTNGGSSVWTGGGPLNLDRDAQFLWWQNTINYQPSDTSSASCRFIFQPPSEITVGLTFISTQGFRPSSSSSTACLWDGPTPTPMSMSVIAVISICSMCAVLVLIGMMVRVYRQRRQLKVPLVKLGTPIEMAQPLLQAQHDNDNNNINKNNQGEVHVHVQAQPPERVPGEADADAQPGLAVDVPLEGAFEEPEQDQAQAQAEPQQEGLCSTPSNHTGTGTDSPVLCLHGVSVPDMFPDEPQQLPSPSMDYLTTPSLYPSPMPAVIPTHIRSPTPAGAPTILSTNTIAPSSCPSISIGAMRMGASPSPFGTGANPLLRSRVALVLATTTNVSID